MKESSWVSEAQTAAAAHSVYNQAACLSHPAAAHACGARNKIRRAYACMKQRHQALDELFEHSTPELPSVFRQGCSASSSRSIVHCPKEIEVLGLRFMSTTSVEFSR
eukprot:scaffold113894_cov19-Tisochrysis_lutea.AAC.3